jgi:hypothetical protein
MSAPTTMAIGRRGSRCRMRGDLPIFVRPRMVIDQSRAALKKRQIWAIAGVGTGQISGRVPYVAFSWRRCCRSSLAETPIPCLKRNSLGTGQNGTRIRQFSPSFCAPRRAKCVASTRNLSPLQLQGEHAFEINSPGCASLHPALRNAAAPPASGAKNGARTRGRAARDRPNAPFQRKAIDKRASQTLYFTAPIVRPRTSWRETMMLKIMTGRATNVPVAMI